MFLVFRKKNHTNIRELIRVRKKMNCMSKTEIQEGTFGLQLDNENTLL